MSDLSATCDEVELVQSIVDELDECAAHGPGIDLEAEQDEMELDEDDEDPGSLEDFVVPDDQPLCEGSEEYVPSQTSLSESFDSQLEECEDDSE